ncbi:MAG: hypothetical protein ACR5LG_10460 [Sodalis sp. (in: enterobacteria)]
MRAFTTLVPATAWSLSATLSMEAASRPDCGRILPARAAFLPEILHHRVIHAFTEGAHLTAGAVAQGLRQPLKGLTQGI